MSGPVLIVVRGRGLTRRVSGRERRWFDSSTGGLGKAGRRKFGYGRTHSVRPHFWSELLLTSASGGESCTTRCSTCSIRGVIAPSDPIIIMCYGHCLRKVTIN